MGVIYDFWGNVVGSFSETAGEGAGDIAGSIIGFILLLLVLAFCWPLILGIWLLSLALGKKGTWSNAAVGAVGGIGAIFITLWIIACGSMIYDWANPKPIERRTAAFQEDKEWQKLANRFKASRSLIVGGREILCEQNGKPIGFVQPRSSTTADQDLKWRDYAIRQGWLKGLDKGVLDAEILHKSKGRYLGVALHPIKKFVGGREILYYPSGKPLGFVQPRRPTTAREDREWRDYAIRQGWLRGPFDLPTLDAQIQRKTMASQPIRSDPPRKPSYSDPPRVLAGQHDPYRLYHLKPADQGEQ